MKNKENIEIRMPILVKLEYLKPNPWNPNKVAKPEMELLKQATKPKYQDGQNVKYAGIITSIKKKYTKNCFKTQLKRSFVTSQFC